MNIRRVWELFVYFLIFACLMASILDAINPSILPNDWHIAAIFAVLFAIFHYIFRLPFIEDRIQKVERKIQAASFRKFDNFTEYYDALSHEMDAAEQELLLMHVRNTSLTFFSARSSYASGVDSWLKKHPEGLVRRISAFPNPDMQEYCDAEEKKALSVSNYYFKVLPQFQNLSMMQVAIFDRNRVFITVPGATPQQTRAIFIDDAEVVGYCVDYYENLWSRAEFPASRTVLRTEIGNAE